MCMNYYNYCLVCSYLKYLKIVDKNGNQIHQRNKCETIKYSHITVLLFLLI